MFFRKKIIMLDDSGKIFSILELTQSGEDVTIKAKEKINLAIYYKNNLSFFEQCTCAILQNYQGGEIHFGALLGEKVFATGSTEGSHEPRLFTQENRKTKENSDSLLTENKNQKDDTKNQEIEPFISETKQKKEETTQQDELSPCNTIEQNEPKIKQQNPQTDKKSHDVHEFYCSIKPNLDEMLTCYPREERLSALIDESSWVKVERTDGYYAVGLIKNEGAPEYICYGVPGKENDLPPDHLKDYCSWIPTDDTGNGYWTVFQDAKTGIAVKNS